MKISDRLKSLGPATLLVATFVGPGTVTTASVTGADFGYALIWTIVFSITMTIILQEMAGRLGLVTRDGLGEAMRNQFDHPVAKYISIVLVVSAIGIGAAAFEVGNVVGGAAGLAGISDIGLNVWAIAIGVTAAILLASGRYKVIERVLMGMVAFMGVAFFISAILIGPEITRIFGGVVPSIPGGSLTLTIGLIGTTVITHNLFLHSMGVQERWDDASDFTIAQMRTDTVVSLAVGGLITISIMVTAAAVFPRGTEIADVSRMAEQIRPLAGPYATLFFSLGLFAAGFTSTTANALAGAYATTGIMGWDNDLDSTPFRAVWLSIVAFGTIVATLGFSPVQVIVLAQVANGLLLPIVAVFLIYVMNNKGLLDVRTNTLWQNVVSGVATLFVIGLGVRSLLGVAGVF